MPKKGYKHSEESKRKISEARKGFKQTEETKKKRSEALLGKKNHNFGKHLSEECRKKLSDTMKGRSVSEEHKRKIADATKGDKNHRWNPNITNEERLLERNYPKYKVWRLKVYEKNNYTCQRCGNRGGKLEAHHIEDYANNRELRTEVCNGITFCKKCHRSFHRIYGKRSNIEEVNEFLGRGH